MTAMIRNRLVLPLQKRGNLGKSTVVSGLAQYYGQRGVPWRGHDLDPDHRNFARLFPDDVVPREITGEEPEGEIIKLARTCSDVAVTLVDIRAHSADVVMRGLGMIRFVETFQEAGGRVTVLLFIGDDLEILTDVDSVVSRLGDTVYYVVIRNPARMPKTKMYDGSALQADLRALDAASLDVPVLLSLARNHLAALEVKLGRGVSAVEAVSNLELPLDAMMRLVIEDWLRVLFRRFDVNAGKLMPADYAAKIKPVDAGPSVEAGRITRGAKLNLTNL